MLKVGFNKVSVYIFSQILCHVRQSPVLCRFFRLSVPKKLGFGRGFLLPGNGFPSFGQEPCSFRMIAMCLKKRRIVSRGKRIRRQWGVGGKVVCGKGGCSVESCGKCGMCCGIIPHLFLLMPQCRRLSTCCKASFGRCPAVGRLGFCCFPFVARLR